MGTEPDRLLLQVAQAQARCSCGRDHSISVADMRIARGAVAQLPARLKAMGVARPYLVMDGNTRQAAGDTVLRLLMDAAMPNSAFTLPASPKPQADMAELSTLRQAMDPRCDFVLGIGSGVINDLCKMLGKETGLRTGIVGTAPSMDGYASNSSAMIVDGVKTTVYNQTPVLIVCDLNILQNAPAAMRGAGIGDMAAKATSIAEWRISHLVTDEYYCGAIAEMMTGAYRQAVDAAARVMRGEAEAVRGLTEGLVLSGIASSMAQVSRPASGSEHTLSHLMDMLAIRRSLPHNLHGMQVGYGVRVALAAYKALLSAEVSEATAKGALRHHRQAAWERDMRRVFGTQAEPLIRSAQAEGRNTPAGFAARAAQAVAHWPAIRAILQTVVDDKPSILAALDAAGIPQLRQPRELGLDPEDVLDCFVHAKDLRSRYILPGLVFDLGLMPWMRDRLAVVLGIETDLPRYFDGV